MRKFAVLAFATAALALVIPAQAGAAPSGTGSAQNTVNALEASGYEVHLSKVGTGELELCTVDSIKPGDSRRGDTMNRVVLQPVYLTARC